jgi:molecular chaperone GrpE
MDDQNERKDSVRVIEVRWISVRQSEYMELERKALRLSELEEKVRHAENPEDLFRALFDIFDDFERLLKAVKEKGGLPDLQEGMELILKNSEQMLVSYDVEKVKSVGEVYDPNLHQILELESVPRSVPFIIQKEFRCGYQRRGRVLRKSLVGF